tara:strand:+ start:43 stop:240 length:198 start_codon:yes stop_codon:yes gene_type:complete
MFLIEYAKDNYINGELIDWIKVHGNRVSFSLAGSDNETFTVDLECKRSFLNHLQALNDNASNIER